MLIPADRSYEGDSARRIARPELFVLRMRLIGALAAEALEWMATPEAAGLLAKLARGDGTARLTREASNACERLRRNRDVPAP